MDYTPIIIAICSVITTIYTITRILAKKFDKIDERFEKINEKINDIYTVLNSLDQRLSRLEGAFLERGQWEGRLYAMQKTITDSKKNGPD